MKITTLEGLFVDELQDIHSAENQLIEVLPKLTKATESVDLRQTLEAHFEEAYLHAQRIEQICGQLEVKPKGKKCIGMEGLIAEGMKALNSDMEPDLLDVALIGAVQRMEHYKIAAYGTARAHARQLGLMGMSNLLNLTLEDEKKTDQRLTELAENRVNVQAAMGHNVLMM